MNKKEISILATREQVLFERCSLYKKTCHYYYEVAVKERKRGNKEDAVRYWNSCKRAYMDYEKASSSWNALFSMKSLLGINTEEYYDLMDKNQVLPERSAHMTIKVGKYDFRFMFSIKKTII